MGIDTTTFQEVDRAPEIFGSAPSKKLITGRAEWQRKLCIASLDSIAAASEGLGEFRFTLIPIVNAVLRWKTDRGVILAALKALGRLITSRCSSVDVFLVALSRFPNDVEVLYHTGLAIGSCSKFLHASSGALELISALFSVLSKHIGNEDIAIIVLYVFINTVRQLTNKSCRVADAIIARDGVSVAVTILTSHAGVADAVLNVCILLTRLSISCARFKWDAAIEAGGIPPLIASLSTHAANERVVEACRACLEEMQKVAGEEDAAVIAAALHV